MNKWQQAIDVVYDSCIDNRGFVITLLSEAEQLQQERDQLAARCELLRKFGAGWAERAGADDQAWDYLSELSSGVYSLTRHDAELLRSFVDKVVPRINAGGPNPIDEELHHCEYTLYQERERIHNELSYWLEREQCQE